MEAEVSEPVLPATYAILPANGNLPTAAPNPSRIEAANGKTPAASTVTVAASILEGFGAAVVSATLAGSMYLSQVKQVPTPQLP